MVSTLSRSQRATQRIHREFLPHRRGTGARSRRGCLLDFSCTPYRRGVPTQIRWPSLPLLESQLAHLFRDLLTAQRPAKNAPNAFTEKHGSSRVFCGGGGSHQVVQISSKLERVSGTGVWSQLPPVRRTLKGINSPCSSRVGIPEEYGAVERGAGQVTLPRQRDTRHRPGVAFYVQPRLLFSERVHELDQPATAPAWEAGVFTVAFILARAGHASQGDAVWAWHVEINVEKGRISRAGTPARGEKQRRHLPCSSLQQDSTSAFSSFNRGTSAPQIPLSVSHALRSCSQLEGGQVMKPV